MATAAAGNAELANQLLQALGAAAAQGTANAGNRAANALDSAVVRLMAAVRSRLIATVVFPRRHGYTLYCKNRYFLNVT